MAEASCAGSINPDQPFNREMDAFFMDEARRSAKLSENNCTFVGACIVDSDNTIIGRGYNQRFQKCSYENFTWSNKTEKRSNNKHFYAFHAEMSAIMNRPSNNVNNCRMYVTLFPCDICARLIIISGIKEVIYKKKKSVNDPKTIAVRKMFDAAGVEYRKYNTI